jgi:prevent-host-death family protein
MAYTVQQAKANLSRLMKEAEEGKDVVIARGKKPAVRLVAVEEKPKRKRVPGQYAGQFQYSDDIFKPMETDEELREYGFAILVDAKVVDREKPDDRVA